MGAKSAKKRPSALPRSLTHVFGGSRNNATDFHNYAPHWTTGPPGLPVENLWNYPDQMRYQAWLGQPRPPFHHSLSPRSTSATVSENNESYLQANNEYKSETTGSSCKWMFVHSIIIQNVRMELAIFSSLLGLQLINVRAPVSRTSDLSNAFLA